MRLGRYARRQSVYCDKLRRKDSDVDSIFILFQPSEPRLATTALSKSHSMNFHIVQKRRKMNTSKANEEITSQPKRLARIAGLLYLIVGIFGGFAVGYVTPMLYVPGDAATTAGNVVANAGLVRIGVLADLLQATVFVFLGMTLYLLLRHVHKNAATAMVILVAIAATIMCL